MNINKISKSKLIIIIILALFVLGLSGYAIAGNKDSFLTSVWNKVSKKENTGGSDKAKSSVDTDEDGLTDDLEKTYSTDPYNPDTDGDGYKDGKEIASGYDPKDNLKGKVAGKSLNSNSKTKKGNSTGIDQSLESISNVSDENINTAVDKVLNRYIEEPKDFKLPEISDKDIKISSKSGSASVKQYLEARARIILKYFPEIEKNNKIDIISAIENRDIVKLETVRDYTDSTYQESKNLEVPRGIAEIHKRSLSVDLAFKNLLDEVLIKIDKLDNNEEDIILLMPMINKINIVSKKAQELNADVENLRKKYNI